MQICDLLRLYITGKKVHVERYGWGTFLQEYRLKNNLLFRVGFSFETIIDKNLTSFLYNVRRRDEKRFSARSYVSNFSRRIVRLFSNQRAVVCMPPLNTKEATRTYSCSSICLFMYKTRRIFIAEDTSFNLIHVGR